MRKLLVLFTAVLFLTGCSYGTSWHGYFYPNPNDLQNYISSPVFTSKDQCESWVAQQARQDTDGSYDYECGKNCRYREDLRIEVCEE